MQPASVPLREQLLEFLWSAWASLGVSGWERRHDAVLLDPEPLIILTAALGNTDARLRDEVIDWCIEGESLVSRARLRALLRSWDLPQDRWGEFAGTVASITGTPWPGADRGRRYEPSGKSLLRVREAGAGLALRVRAGLGVSARAEIVSRLLVRPRPGLTAREVSITTGYTPRSASDALKALLLASMVEPVTDAGPARYTLRCLTQLRTVFDPLPKAAPAWPPTLLGAWVLYRGVETTQAAPPAVRSMEARGTLDQARPHLSAAGIALPAVPPGIDAEPVLVDVASRLLHLLAAAAPLPKRLDSRVARYA